MEPKKVVTKGKTLYDLTKTFMAWKQDSLKQKFADFVKRQNKNLLSQPLVTFDQKLWTVSDFIKKFNPQIINKNFSNKEKIGGELSKQIALEVRDDVLSKLAFKSDLEMNENVQRQLKEWRDKWVYDEARRLYLKKIEISDDEVKNYFDKNIKLFQISVDEIPKYSDYKNTAKKFAYIQKAEKILLSRIDSLKKFYPIRINKAVLDTIKTIDFEKSRWQSLQVFKRSSNRLAVPIVDPAWNIQ